MTGSQKKNITHITRLREKPWGRGCSKIYWGFSHDVTKIQTTKLSILLSFYFYEVLQHLKTFIYTNFRFQRVLRFAIEDS